MDLRPEDKIINAFYQDKNSLQYIEIKEKTNISDNTLSRTLKKLTNHKILKKTISRTNSSYIISNKDIVAIKFALFDILKFQDLNNDVLVPLKELVKITPRNIFSIILFGSTSTKTEHKNSDIDICFIVYQNSIKKQIEQIIKTEIAPLSLYPINTIIVSFKEFEKQEDHLLKQVKLTGFPIMNQQNYRNWIIKNEN